MTSTPASPGRAPGAAVGRGADAERPLACGDRPGACAAEHGRWLRRLKLQRQLHDGASLRISALVPQLGVVRNRMPGEPTDLQASIEGLQDQLHLVLQELREIARGIYPPLLDEAGLGPALREFADRAAVPVRVVADAERFGAPAEGAVYFAVTGCLGGLPAGGPPVDVVVRRAAAALEMSLTGVPLEQATAVRAEVCGLGGEVTATGDPEAGTITARIPCE